MLVNSPIKALIRALPALLLGMAMLAGPPASAEPIYPPASRIGLAPPAQFILSPSFAGFQHNDKQASIVIAELPAYAYENFEKEIDAEIARNPQAPRKAAIALGEGLRGFVLSGTEESPQGSILKWTLVATGKGVTALITALIPQALEELAPEAEILKTFASLTIRASVPTEELLSVLPFSMRDLAGFRIVRAQPRAGAMLTDGPNDVIESAEQPLLLVTLGQAPATQPAERDGFARRLIGETPGLKEIKVIRAEPLRIGNQQGHEVQIEAKDAKSDHDIRAVQWLRFGAGNSILRIFGMTRKDAWDANYPRFRAVRDGIAPR